MEQGFDPVQVGYGFGVPVPGMPLTSTDPTKEYVAGAFGRLTPRIPQLLPIAFDDITKNFGIRTYLAMLTDPAVKSSFNSLKFGILGGEVEVMPAVKVRPWQKKFTADEQMAIQCKEFCERAVQRTEVPFEQTCMQWLDGMALGVKLAEKTTEYTEGGVDAGKLQLRSVKVKPYWAWQFVVDTMMNVKGILTFLPAGPLNPDAKWNADMAKGNIRSGYVILPRNKFAVFTWLPEDNDPRGSSILRAAYTAWNLKLQTLPHLYQHLIKFASPGLDMEMAPNDTAMRPPIDPTTGQPLQGKAPVDPFTYMVQVLQFYRNNGILVHPHDSKLNKIDPSEGEAFWRAFDWFDRQIVLAIENQVRTTLESKHGSRADSETSQDTKGLVIQWGRKTLAGTVRRDVFYDLCKDNFGEEVADRFTPIPSFGKAEHQDLPARWTAIAALNRTAMFTFSQWAELCADNGLPVPDPEEWQAMMAEKQAQAEAIAGAKTGKTNDGKPADDDTEDDETDDEEGALDDDKDKESLKQNPNVDNEDTRPGRKAAGK